MGSCNLHEHGNVVKNISEESEYFETVKEILKEKFKIFLTVIDSKI